MFLGAAPVVAERISMERLPLFVHKDMLRHGIGLEAVLVDALK